MANWTTKVIRMDSEIKKEAELVCEDIGIPLATAINIFVKALAREKRFPFPLESTSGSAPQSK